MDSISNIRIDFTGKIALITGGTRGIGRAIAARFLEAGSSVILTGTNLSEIEQLNKENAIERISYLQLDFTDKESVERFLLKLSKFDRVDVLINNAGINKVALNIDTTDADFDLLHNVNVKGPYILCREVSKLMKRNGYGRIVNITSIWSTITRPGRSVYATNKNAIVGLTKTLAVELGKDNILVNAVAPGFTLTELTAATNSAEDLQKLTEIIPMNRMAQPVEIANVILFLSSDLNSYLTGQNIIVDGGYTNV
ncbi:SDR family NAD(P)-dependent oxidoreductase [Mucilaginibacter sp. KACC 22773]|uniref:SDR family NAD(P)-dependent oxidoreductase n=1 Tax=Mucilaginibacter sp. KACC 22773 TaxID=3025671 RepID=UPI002365FF73|nr:SDR family NAD(P)-dependent oxidoreductase [Mucilaginibacter sp. KACC 22773]WDF79157.1 SDR family NAD(P)-dependent oxidoreductase [Mucilaginibacter sp. KACC 22773]